MTYVPSDDCGAAGCGRRGTIAAPPWTEAVVILARSGTDTARRVRLACVTVTTRYAANAPGSDTDSYPPVIAERLSADGGRRDCCRSSPTKVTCRWSVTRGALRSRLLLDSTNIRASYSLCH
jgi:hypothetical protein